MSDNGNRPRGKVKSTVDLITDCVIRDLQPPSIVNNEGRLSSVFIQLDFDRNIVLLENHFTILWVALALQDLSLDTIFK